MTKEEAWLQSLKDAGLIVDFRMTGPNAAVVHTHRPIEHLRIVVNLPEEPKSAKEVAIDGLKRAGAKALPLHGRPAIRRPEIPQDVPKEARVPLRGTENPDPTAAAPGPIDPESGQHTDYWVLSEEERAKGFCRPVRRSYVHVGPPGPKYPLRDLTDEEHERYDQFGYVKYEEYPEGSPEKENSLGMYWTQERLDKIDKGCGVKTTMGQVLAETYARKPDFYGSTFCCGCKTHLPVGRQGEFVWDGTDERVGT